MKDRDTILREIILDWERATIGIPLHGAWSKAQLQVLINAALDEQDKITSEGFESEIKRLTKAIERLGSSEAMTMSFMINFDTREGKEMCARLDYARAALNTRTNQGGSK